jgi:hypothetical protein
MPRVRKVIAEMPHQRIGAASKLCVGGHDVVPICFASSEAKLSEALDRLEAALG